MFLEREDRALKLKLRDLVRVSDLASGGEGRAVDVWFRFPDKEVRDVVYPFLTIDFVGLRKASEREHRALTDVHYVPEEFEYVGPGTAITAEYPIPYDLTYTITAWSRHPLHDRQITAQLLQINSRLAMRNTWLEVPEDETVRTLDVQGMEVADFTRDGKRTFRKVFMVVVTAELFSDSIQEVGYPTETVLDVKPAKNYAELYDLVTDPNP